jgi:hypothetical protein
MKQKRPNPIPGNKPFPKGVSGNPKGRPKLPDLKAAIAKVLADEKDGYNALEACLMALRAKAAKGDVRAAEVLLDRAFGKAKQSHDLTSDGEAIKWPAVVGFHILDTPPADKP